MTEQWRQEEIRWALVLRQLIEGYVDGQRTHEEHVKIDQLEGMVNHERVLHETHLQAILLVITRVFHSIRIEPGMTITSPKPHLKTDNPLSEIWTMWFFSYYNQLYLKAKKNSLLLLGVVVLF